MKSRTTRRLVAARTFRRSVLALCVLSASAAAARAQMPAPDSGENYRKLMERRAEMSRRSIDEVNQRRLEDKKPFSKFPSDAREKGKPGVTRAMTPEERKAAALVEKGLKEFAAGRFEQAVAQYAEALRAHPQYAAAHNNMGSAYFAMGRNDEAVAAFKRAVEIEPGYAQAHFNLALMYIKLNRADDANRALDLAARAYLAEGEKLFGAGRVSEAEESYKGLLRIDPKYGPAHLRLGMIYNTTDRFAEAAESLAAAVRLEPNDSEGHENLAEALYGLKKYADALASADKASKLKPDSAGAHYIAGLSLAALGRRDEAVQRHARLKELNAAEYAQYLQEVIDRKQPPGR